jgi:hypothetical protein
MSVSMKARRHHVDGDAARTDLARQRLGERNDAGLRGGVVGLARVAGKSDHRGDRDDASLARLHHAAHHRLGSAVDRAEIGIEDDFQSSSRMRISNWSRVMPALLTRIETAPNSLPMSSINASTAAPVGDIQHPAVAAVRSQPLADGRGTGFAGCRADHRGPHRGQFIGNRRANAATGAGDQRDFTLQCLAHRWFP